MRSASPTWPPHVRMTHPERVLYRAQGITKAGLARYYVAVAERMLPHVVNRPLMLVRCPAGSDKPCFYQKHPPRGVPRAVRLVAPVDKTGHQPSMVIDDLDGLLGLVQIGALEIHAWGSRVDRLERPDQLTFDLDPDEGLPWPRVVEAARAVRKALDALALPTFLKTTGGKGLHVVVPIDAALGWDEAKRFSKQLVDGIAQREPDKYVTVVSKAARKNRVLLDYLRNARGATAVVPYSTRAKEGAPIATPIAWSELRATLQPARFSVTTVVDRVSAHADPWASFDVDRATLAGHGPPSDLTTQPHLRLK